MLSATDSAGWVRVSGGGLGTTRILHANQREGKIALRFPQQAGEKTEAALDADFCSYLRPLDPHQHHARSLLDVIPEIADL